LIDLCNDLILRQISTCSDRFLAPWFRFMFSGRLKSSCDRLSGVAVLIVLMITTATVVKSCLECWRRGWRQTLFVLLYDADSKVIVPIRAGWEVLTRQELREARHVSKLVARYAKDCKRRWESLCGI
jgi:hypothetical protein